MRPDGRLAPFVEGIMQTPTSGGISVLKMQEQELANDRVVQSICIDLRKNSNSDATADPISTMDASFDSNKSLDTKAADRCIV